MSSSLSCGCSQCILQLPLWLIELEIIEMSFMLVSLDWTYPISVVRCLTLHGLAVTSFIFFWFNISNAVHLIINLTWIIELQHNQTWTNKMLNWIAPVSYGGYYTLYMHHFILLCLIILWHCVNLKSSLYFQLIYPPRVIQLSSQNIPQGYILVGLEYQIEAFLKWSWALAGTHILTTQKRL